MNTPIKKPVVINDEIVIRKRMNINSVMDHRYGDGAQGAQILKRLKEVWKNPEKFY